MITDAYYTFPLERRASKDGINQKVQEWGN
jgi:hypothetical protein